MKNLHIADCYWSVGFSVEVARETAVYGLDSLVADSIVTIIIIIITITMIVIIIIMIVIIIVKVADFGGMLSLFLGVSFMTIWHLLLALVAKLHMHIGQII